MNNNSPVRSGRERFAEVVADLRKRYGAKADKIAGANEASTRLLLVDEILVALGWPKDSFHPETCTSDGTYMDYRITLDDIPRFVVEAKRIGHTFAPSNNKLRKTEYLLSYMRQAFGAPFTEVLQQAEEYCRNIRVPFAVLTNGAEWVLAQVLPIPGVAADRLRCYYFGNILDDNHNLNLMWERLSKPAVSQSLIEEGFSTLNPLETEYCVEPRSLVGELRWKAAREVPNLRDFYDSFFDEITDPGRRNMLEYCYVTNPKLAQCHGALKRTLLDTAPAFVSDAEELPPGDSAKVLPDGLGDQKGRVVLVVGSVGAGKSTFVKRTVIENRNAGGLIFVDIDLINEGVLHADGPPERLWHLLMDRWIKQDPSALDFEKLCRAFHAELEQLRRGPYAQVFQSNPESFEKAKAEKLHEMTMNPERCLSRMWRHCARSRKSRVVVFLDNVDRASEHFQHRMYAFAHAVAAETGATVIVTMRESTYYRAKDCGFLDVRTSDKVFHLQAPNIVQLVSKRVKYVEDHMHKDHRATSWKHEKDWKSFQADCQTYANALKETFLGDEQGHRLLSILAALAWHNIRAFLTTLRRIHALLAGNNENTNNRWTYDHVLSALMSADTSGSLRAIPTTLYRPPSTRHSCFLLKLRLLLLLKVGVRRLEQQQGVGHTRIIEFARGYGYRRQWTEIGLEELVRERLVECLQIPSEVEQTSSYSLSNAHVFRTSPLGILLVESLMHHPIYLSASAWEVPYHSKQLLDEFLESAKDALVDDELVSCELDPERAELLGASSVPDVVKKILATAYSQERLFASDLVTRAEVSTVEENLREAMGKLGVAAEKIQVQSTKQAPRPGEPVQTSLFQESTPVAQSKEVLKISVPEGIKDIKIEGSSSAPLVFWSLAFAHVNSLGPQKGAELTKIINRYLCDDYQQLAPTNVSRLLRSPVMAKQKWLRQTGKPRSWRYSLAQGWREHWVRIFDSQPPGLAPPK